MRDEAPADVAAAIKSGAFKGSAFDHYNSFGFREGRDPNALFDSSFYLLNNVDVFQAGINPLALATPSLAISSAAREALHQADIVETMLRGVLPVMRDNDLELAERLRKMDDHVDELYSAIKFYLTQISREALSEREGRRWTDIISFTINMEQIGDIIERVLQDVEDKKIRKNRSFSDAGMAEICHLHERLIANLRLAMSVFLDGHVRDAKKLLELFRKHRCVRLAVSGHIHKLDRCEFEGVTYVCDGAVSGAWWKGPGKRCDEGYGVFDLFSDGSFEHTYHTYGWKPREG